MEKRELREWFVGFVDAEGCFIIEILKKYVRFRLQIKLHKDDIKVLEEISKILEVKPPNIYREEAILRINKYEDIDKKIIPIFKEIPLKTTKGLDFKKFIEAFEIKREYINKEIPDIELERIKELKNKMNTQREKEELKGQIEITGNWLLGFIEGDGSFNLSNLRPILIITQLGTNRLLLKLIGEFLKDLPPKELSERIQLNIIEKLDKRNKEELYDNVVSSLDFIWYKIIPFLRDLTFRSKKELEFKLWVEAARLNKLGFRQTQEGKILLNKIRLIINKRRKVVADEKKEELILTIKKYIDTNKPLIEEQIIGKEMKTHTELSNKVADKLLRQKGYIIYVYIKKQIGYELLDKYTSLNKASKELRIGIGVISKYIDTSLEYKNKYKFNSKPLKDIDKRN